MREWLRSLRTARLFVASLLSICGVLLLLPELAGAQSQPYQLTIDTPSELELLPSGTGFAFRGWVARTADCRTGPNFDTLHVYLDGPAGGGGHLLGGQELIDRPDVPAATGCPGWRRSGFSATVTLGVSGSRTLYFYAFRSAESARPLVGTYSITLASPSCTSAAISRGVRPIDICPSEAPRPTPTRVPATPTPAFSPSGLPLIDAPRTDTRFNCLARNPSCGRDPWWAEWNEVQESHLVAYRFAPGFVTEFRFIEAVWLLWRWPEGRELISAAAASGVSVWTQEERSDSFAGYSPLFNWISFDRRYTETSTWMVADVLAHELRHAVDAGQGITNDGTPDRCVWLEQRAYETEARYVRWLSAGMGGLPTTLQVATQLSTEDLILFVNISEIARSPNPAALAARDSQQTCTVRFGGDGAVHGVGRLPDVPATVPATSTATVPFQVLEAATESIGEVLWTW